MCGRSGGGGGHPVDGRGLVHAHADTGLHASLYLVAREQFPGLGGPFNVDAADRVDGHRGRVQHQCGLGGQGTGQDRAQAPDLALSLVQRDPTVGQLTALIEIPQ